MVFLPQGAESQAFTQKLQKLVKESPDYHLLTAGIRSSYRSTVASRKAQGSVKSTTERTTAGSDLSVGAVLFETDASSFLSNSGLDGEIFGPTTMLVQHSNREELLTIAHTLGGHLTATIHGTGQDLHAYADLIAILENKVGRLIFNGFPTGVEVTHAMVHGGPYPATSDGRSTSVGSLSILRFARPVCYQGFPDEVLPAELKDPNPLGIWRMIDGRMTREANNPALARQAG